MDSSVLVTVVCLLALACSSAPETAPAEVQPEHPTAPGADGVERGSSDEATDRSRFLGATRALNHGRFEDAYWEFQALAGQCESGEWGRRSVLTLAAELLDPRNPLRFPEAGAQLAARYLQIPSSPEVSKALARSLYVHALDLGAGPVDDPFGPIPVLDPETTIDPATDREVVVRRSPAGSWRVAPRFDQCRSQMPPTAIRSLPEPPESTLYGDLEDLSRDRDALRVRIDSLQSELERVRGLLRSNPVQADTAPRPP